MLGKSFTRAALAALTGSASAARPLLHSLVRKEIVSLQSDPRSRSTASTASPGPRPAVAYETLSRRSGARHLAAAEHLLPTEDGWRRSSRPLVEAYRLDPDAVDAPRSSGGQAGAGQAGESGTLAAAAEASAT